jgi:AcrR family transcriptional regulator
MSLFCEARIIFSLQTLFYSLVSKEAQPGEGNLADEPITPKGRKTRARLVAATRIVMARVGFAQMRMSDVAAESGMSLGALYRYFTNKEDLFATLVGDIHQDLYSQSAAPNVNFAQDPYGALYASNLGYLTHYYENRDVMKVLMEVMTVDQQLLQIWWNMRQRHIRRFLNAMQRHHGSKGTSDMIELRKCEAVVSMVEMSAYSWYAQETLNDEIPSLEEATETVTDLWYGAFFKDIAARQTSSRAAS